MTTLQNLRDQFYDILREDEQDTTAYPLSLTDQLLNTSQLRICSGRVSNPLTKETVRKGSLPFLNTDRYYANIQSTSLDEDTTVGAVTLTVTDTTDFETSGVLYIAGNIITYTGKTATTFTGCSNVLFAFTAGQEVSVALTLPTDYMNPIQIIYNNRFKLQAKNYDEIFEDLNDIKGNIRNRTKSLYNNRNSVPFYTIKDNAYMLVFNIEQTDDIILLRYEAKPSTMTASTDLATISDDNFAKSTIPYLAVGEILYNRGEEQRAGEILNFALGQVREMYDYYNNTGYEKISGTHYKIGKSRLNI